MNEPVSSDESPEEPGIEPKSPSDSKYEDELLIGHEYDGIREYDNPIPPWLSLIFTGTIIWSFFYVVAINLGYIDRYEESLEEGQQAIASMRRETQANQKKMSNKLLAKAVDKSKRVKNGKKLFTSNCSPCHGKKGGGQIGPNLTDKYWIHGGKLTDIYKTIANGVQAKQMPAWKSKLKRKEMVDVVAFVRSIQGTEPPDAKKPEGDPYEPGNKGS
jgi:cytochrome c oxidase cbb3-type subunit 3